MKYWYKMADNNDRVYAKRRGEEAEPITLYPDSEEIREDFYAHGGWMMVGACTEYDTLHKCEFDSLEDAERFYYAVWDGTPEEFKEYLASIL